MQLEPVPQYNTHLPFTLPWDATCDRRWQEWGGQCLPWDEIRGAYRDEKE
jgi:hypothetical protein